MYVLSPEEDRLLDKAEGESTDPMVRALASLVRKMRHQGAAADANAPQPDPDAAAAFLAEALAS